jgi:hypothetical protein
MRVYDPRLGKFLSVDPLSPKYPELTPYQFASNRPIDANDLDGAESSHWDPVRRQWMMPSDAIRHPLPPGAFMPSAADAKYAAQNGRNILLFTVGGAGVVIAAPSAAALIGRAGWSAAAWVSQPQNQMLVGEGVAFTAGVLNPGPEDITPGSSSDELGRVTRQIFKKGLSRVEQLLWKNLSGLCFVSGTKIHTRYGDKNIEDIQVGDSVWSYKQLVVDSTGKLGGICQLKKVVRIYQNHVSKLVRVNVGNDKEHVILTTTEHPFFVEGKWVEAGKLSIGDPLTTLGKFDCKVVSLQKLDTSDIQVFNFEVEENHNYFVGEDGVLVHNNCDEKWLSATYQYGKHVLFGSANKELKGKSWKDIVKSTKIGEAMYKSLIPEEVRALEQKAIQEGTKLNMKKGVDYYIYDAGEVIGATGGKEASHLRVEVTSTGQYHGHPLSLQEYNQYLKKYGQ